MLHFFNLLHGGTNIIISMFFIYLPGAGNFCLVHVSLVPVLNVVGEQVSKLLTSQSIHNASLPFADCGLVL